MRLKLTMAAALAMTSVFAVAACGSGGEKVRSGSGPTARATAETSETGPASPQARETTAEAAAVPSTSPLLAVVGTVVVPDGEASGLSVVLVGQPDADQPMDSVPVVVRNRTGSTVYGVEASATARAGDGSLAGSGSSQGFTPFTVEPGEWAFGYVFFGADLPGDARIDVTATGETESGLLSRLDVRPVETNIVASQFGQQIVGIVSNENSEKVSGPISVDAICFDAGGTAIIGTHRTFTDGDEIAPGGTASFAIDLFKGECPNYAVGGAGFNW